MMDDATPPQNGAHSETPNTPAQPAQPHEDAPAPAVPQGSDTTGVAANMTGTTGETGKTPDSKPEYGGLLSDYPGWNPYVYGAPDKDKKTRHLRQRRDEEDTPEIPDPVDTTGLNPWGFPSPYGRADGNNSTGTGNANNPTNTNGQLTPEEQAMWNAMSGGFSPDDPQRNPWYGQFDSMAVAAFITAFLLPVVGLVCGLISMHRTRTLHMRGHGLAVASVIISVALLIFSIYFVSSGQYDQMMSVMRMMYGGGVPDPTGTGGATPAPTGAPSTPQAYSA